MNDHRTNNPLDRTGPVPPELAGVAGALDRLGQHERGSMPKGLEDRLIKGVLVARVGGRLDALGRAEGGAAGATLEHRVHEASRGELGAKRAAGATPGPRDASEEREVVGRIGPVSRMGWAMRMAAGVALVGGGVLAYVALNAPPAPSNVAKGPTGPNAADATASASPARPTTDAGVEGALAMLASIDRAFNSDALEDLVREADGFANDPISESVLSLQ